jgi:hypothetical protein
VIPAVLWNQLETNAHVEVLLLKENARWVRMLVGTPSRESGRAFPLKKAF